MATCEAELIAAGLGCPACRRVRRSTFGRAIELCKACNQGPARAYLARELVVRGWSLVRVEIVRYVMSSKVSWLALVWGRASKESAYYAPAWVESVSELGSKLLAAKLTTGAKLSPLALTVQVVDCRRMIAIASEDVELQRLLVSLAELGAKPADVRDFLVDKAPGCIAVVRAPA